MLPDSFFALPKFAIGKARKPMAYFRIYCPARLTRCSTLLLPISAETGGESRKVIVGIWYKVGKTFSRKRNETAMLEENLQSLNEVIIGSARPDVAKLLFRLKRDGRVKRLAPRIYTTNLTDSAGLPYSDPFRSHKGGYHVRCRFAAVAQCTTK